MEDDNKMEGSKYFNRKYFLLELKTAGAIINKDENDLDSLTLKKVPNITIGLVLAAKAQNLFEDHIILNWIRKGRKLTSLIEEQFDLYDKLATYLLNNICTEEDILEWKEILNNTKYVYPANEKEGWAQIFGETPNILEKVDTKKVQQIEESEPENNQENDETHTLIEERKETMSVLKSGKNNEPDSTVTVTVIKNRKNDEPNPTAIIIHTDVDKQQKEVSENNESCGIVTEDILEEDNNDNIDKSSSKLFNPLEKVNCSSELSDDKEALVQSELGDDSSDAEDDLDDLFNAVEAELNAAEENDDHELNAAEEKCDQSEKTSSNEKKQAYDLSGTAINLEKKEGTQYLEKTEEILISEKETKEANKISDNKNDLTLPVVDLDSKPHDEIQDHGTNKRDETLTLNDSVDCVLEMEAPEDELFDFLETTTETLIAENKRKQSDETSDNINDLNLTANETDLKSNNRNHEHMKDQNYEKSDIGESKLEEEATEEDELFDFLEAELGAAEAKLSSAENETNDTRSNSAKPSEDCRDNSTKRMENQFENVIIFADEVYKPFLQHMDFKNDYQKVWVAADDELTPKNLKKLVPECSKLSSGSGKLLCVLVTGLYNFAPMRNPKVLPLPQLPAIGNLFMEFDYRKTIYYRKKHQVMIKEMLLKGWKCQRFVKEHLDPEATVVLAPPLPGFIVQYGKHFATDEKFLVETYKEFCTQWSKMCCDMFSIEGLDTKIIKYYMLGCNEFLSVMHPSVSHQDVKVRLNDWYEMIKLLLTSNYKEKVSNNFCAPFNHDMKCRKVTKTSKCPHPHRCEICGQGGHGKKKCHVLDHSICLKYNWTFCNSDRCKYKHVCYSCENAHLVIDCSKNFMQHNNIQSMVQNLYRKVRYRRVILVGNQIALTPFILSRIPELKVIANIRQLAIDINLDSHESTMQALYAMQVHMVNHPEFTADTLWILMSDMTNWLESDSLCRSHFSDQLCTEEIKMSYLKYDLSTQFYKAEEFVKSTKPYLGVNSDFILAPLIGQTVLYPPAIGPSDIPSSICPPGLEKIDLNDFHKIVHDSPGLQKLQTFSPGVSKNVLSQTLATIDKRWLDSVENIMRWQNVSVFPLSRYLRYKDDTFKVMEDINLTPPSNSYLLWDAFMVLLIKYLCDPMSETVELSCDFSKKIYDIREGNEYELENKKDLINDTSIIEEIKREENVLNTEKSEEIAHIQAEWTPVVEIIDKKIKSESDGFNSVMDKINRKIRSEKIAEHIESFTQSYGSKNEKQKASEPKPKHKEHSSRSKNSQSKERDEKTESKSKASPSVSKKSSSILREVIIEDAKKKILLYNLPKELKSDDVHEMLRACGDTQEFEREVLDEKTKSAHCSVKFKDVYSVYRTYRLLNGRTICGKTLSVKVPMHEAFNRKEKEVNGKEVAEKQALDRIKEVVTKVEKKKKLLRGYLKSATKEKESKLQVKKEVDKEKTSKEESITNAKKKEEIVEAKLKEAFHRNDPSTPLFPCANSAEDSCSQKNEENKKSRSSHNDKRYRPRSKERENGSGNKDELGRRKRSRSRDRNDRGNSSSNKERIKSSRSSKSPSRRPRRTRSRSRDRIRRSKSNDIDRTRRLGSKDTDRIRRSGSRDTDRIRRSGSKDNNRSKRSGSRDINRSKRSGSRDINRTKWSGSREVNYKSDAPGDGLSEAERRSLAGEFSRIGEWSLSGGDKWNRDKEKVPKNVPRSSQEKNRSRSRENSLSRLHDSNPKSREHGDMRRQLTPIHEDKSRSPRRYASNRSRSRSRSRSPPRQRSFWPERDRSPAPSRQQPLPTPPPAPRRGQYNQDPGLVTYPAMFGSVNPSTSKVHQTQTELISYSHLSQDAQKPKTSNSTSDSSSKFSVLGICNMLFSMCDQLDILGKSLKIVLEKAFVVKHDEYEMLKVFGVDDHLVLMNMVLTRFSKLLEVAPDTQTKNTIENLVNYTKYLVKMAENPSSFLASSSKSNNSDQKINPNPPSNAKSLMFGIDVEKVAKLTINRDTSYIIAYLKNALENIGTTPTKEMVSKLALEISIQHFKLASTSGAESLSVDYGHGSSSAVSSRKQQPVSIDYGHGGGVSKSSSSFSSERNWGSNEDTNRSGSKSLHTSWNVGQDPNADSRYVAATNWNQQQQDRIGHHYSTEPSRSAGSMQVTNHQQQSAGHLYQSSAEPSISGSMHLQDQARRTGHLYESGGANNYPGSNTWTSQSSGNNMGGYGWDQSQGNTVIPHDQRGPHENQRQGSGTHGTTGSWPQTYAAPKQETGSWPQTYAATGSLAQTWPQGQTSVMPQSSSSTQDQFTNKGSQQYY